MDEAVRFLSTKEIEHKIEILLQTTKCMNSLTYVGEKKYTPDVIARAFEYFALSRSLYSRLREDYELPSVSTLTKLISKVSSLQDIEWLSNVVSKLDEKDKSCIFCYWTRYMWDLVSLIKEEQCLGKLWISQINFLLINEVTKFRVLETGFQTFILESSHKLIGYCIYDSWFLVLILVKWLLLVKWFKWMVIG